MKAAKRRRSMDRKIVKGLRAGKSANELSRHLGVCKKTIKRVRERAEQYGYLSAEVELPRYPEALFPEIRDRRSERVSATDELLQPHIEWVKEKLELGWYPITVHEELPVTVPRANFYRFLTRHGLKDTGKSARVVPEILSAPGEVLQVDWGKLRSVEIDGKKRTVWALTGVLGFSRYRLVRLVWDTKLETTLLALRSMFEELGGVPAKITSDNEKCFAHKASRYEAVLNPVMERFAEHYGTLIECLPPRAPQKKGKVERQIPYMRRLYQAHGDNWWGLEESQDYLNQKLAVANQKRHGTTRLCPAQVFNDTERAALKPLPEIQYDIEHYHKGTVRRDGHVRFQGKYYSVDESQIGAEVVVLGNSLKIHIYSAGKLIEVHDRVTDPHRSKSTKLQHRKPWERTFEEHSVYRFRARAIGEWVEELVITILAQGNGFIDFRKIWGILSLDKTFPCDIVDQACKLAHEQGRWSYQAVRDFSESLAARTSAEEPAAPTPRAAKFVHDINNYTQLTLIEGGKNEQRNCESTTTNTQHEHRSKGA